MRFAAGIGRLISTGLERAGQLGRTDLSETLNDALPRLGRSLEEQQPVFLRVSGTILRRHLTLDRRLVCLIGRSGCLVIFLIILSLRLLPVLLRGGLRSDEVDLVSGEGDDNAAVEGSQ